MMRARLTELRDAIRDTIDMRITRADDCRREHMGWRMMSASFIRERRVRTHADVVHKHAPMRVDLDRCTDHVHRLAHHLLCSPIGVCVVMLFAACADGGLGDAGRSDAVVDAPTASVVV
jgi:hypothetical protein